VQCVGCHLRVSWSWSVTGPLCAATVRARRRCMCSGSSGLCGGMVWCTPPRSAAHGATQRALAGGRAAPVGMPVWDAAAHGPTVVWQRAPFAGVLSVAREGSGSRARRAAGPACLARGPRLADGPAWRSASGAIPSGTASLPTCWSRAPTSARCRSCWGTRTSRQRCCIPTSSTGAVSVSVVRWTSGDSEGDATLWPHAR
jgi:hypothetical protein